MTAARLLLAAFALLTVTLVAGGIEAHRPEIPEDGASAILSFALLSSIEHGPDTSEDAEPGCGSSCSSSLGGPTAMATALTILSAALVAATFRSAVDTVPPGPTLRLIAPPPR